MNIYKKKLFTKDNITFYYLDKFRKTLTVQVSARTFALNFINFFLRRCREIHRMALQENFSGRRLFIRNFLSRLISQSI